MNPRLRPLRPQPSRIPVASMVGALVYLGAVIALALAVEMAGL